MREIYFESRTGDPLKIDGKKPFFHAPTGLGYMEGREYFSTGNGFFCESNNMFGQPNIVGEFVLFGNNKYMQYAELVKWLHDNAPFRMVYVATHQREPLYMDVDVESIEKSEITPHGTLELPVSILGKSPYYYPRPTNLIFTNKQVGSPKKYPYKYDYMYARNGGGNVEEFIPNGHFDAALELQANGPISRLVLRAENLETGEPYGVLELPDVSVPKGSKLIWSSRPNEAGVWLVTDNKKTDLATQLDLSNNNFFTLPAGKWAKVSFAYDVAPEYGEKELRHDLYVYEYYKG